jgi:hypothetical protein
MAPQTTRTQNAILAEFASIGLDFCSCFVLYQPPVVVQGVFMNARVKRVMTAQAQQAADRGDGLVVVRAMKKRPIWIDRKFKGWIRRVVVDRKNDDLHRPPDAVSEHSEINEGITAEQDQTT